MPLASVRLDVRQDFTGIIVKETVVVAQQDVTESQENVLVPVWSEIMVYSVMKHAIKVVEVGVIKTMVSVIFVKMVYLEISVTQSVIHAMQDATKLRGNAVVTVQLVISGKSVPKCAIQIVKMDVIETLVSVLAVLLNTMDIYATRLVALDVHPVVIEETEVARANLDGKGKLVTVMQIFFFSFNENTFIEKNSAVNISNTLLALLQGMIILLKYTGIINIF